MLMPGIMNEIKSYRGIFIANYFAARCAYLVKNLVNASLYP